MAEAQPPAIVEGATTGDVDDEIPVAAKSAEDRKAAAALSSLDAPREDESSSTKDVDQEAVRKAMDRLAGSGANGAVAKKEDGKKVVKKAVKVDQADITLLVCRLYIYKFIAHRLYDYTTIQLYIYRPSLCDVLLSSSPLEIEFRYPLLDDFQPPHRHSTLLPSMENHINKDIC